MYELYYKVDILIIAQLEKLINIPEFEEFYVEEFHRRIVSRISDILRKSFFVHRDRYVLLQF